MRRISLARSLGSWCLHLLSPLYCLAPVRAELCSLAQGGVQGQSWLWDRGHCTQPCPKVTVWGRGGGGCDVVRTEVRAVCRDLCSSPLGWELREHQQEMLVFTGSAFSFPSGGCPSFIVLHGARQCLSLLQFCHDGCKSTNLG